MSCNNGADRPVATSGRGGGGAETLQAARALLATTGYGFALLDVTCRTAPARILLKSRFSHGHRCHRHDGARRRGGGGGGDAHGALDYL